MKKKKLYIIAIILVLVILLVPIRMNLKDGGSVRYKSLICEITRIHQLAPEVDAVKPYIDGLEVKILGMTIYRETNEQNQKIQFSEESNDEEIIIYDGKEYKKSELCDATLHWLELTEQERIASSYLPPEFLVFEENWGITLMVEDITPTKATIKCTQTGGEATGELQTGSWYVLQSWTQKDGWKEVPHTKTDVTLTWTQEAWLIPMEDTAKWEQNWEWLYGELPKGRYRIGKEFTDFRSTGDFDTALYFAEFEISE